MDIRIISVSALALLFSSNTMSTPIVINEFLPNAIGTDSGNEWIELYNDNTNAVDISGWQIQKSNVNVFDPLYFFHRHFIVAWCIYGSGR